eukprot:10485951-Lingulodinium_polyedra.AAC.1
MAAKDAQPAVAHEHSTPALAEAVGQGGTHDVLLVAVDRLLGRDALADPEKVAPIGRRDAEEPIANAPDVD